MRHMALLLLGTIVLTACSQGSDQGPGASPQAQRTEARTLTASLERIDPAAGKDITVWCGECHGENGVSAKTGVPNLANQGAGYLYTRLHAYQTGEREHPVMSNVVKSLGDPAMRKVAVWYAHQPPAPVSRKALAQAAADEQQAPSEQGRVAATACAGCHGEDGNSVLAGTPRLAGQHATDLEAAIKAYRRAARDNQIMHSMATELSDVQIRNLALFFSQQQPRQAAKLGGGDPQAGKRVAGVCAGCHGADGNSLDPNIPSLAGQDQAYLIHATNAYTKGARHYVMMKYPVAYLSAADVENLAAYYAHQKPKKSPGGRSLGTRQWAQRCDRCHGPGGNSRDPRFPSIAGQNRKYLAAALHAYQSGFRKNRMMNAMTAVISPDQATRLAAHYAAKEPAAAEHGKAQEVAN